MNLAMRIGIEKMPRLYQMKPEKEIYYRRKVMRVGGSVVVPIPKKLRQDLGIGVGEYVKITMVGDHSILIKKEEKAWDGRVTRKD